MQKEFKIILSKRKVEYHFLWLNAVLRCNGASVEKSKKRAVAFVTALRKRS